MRRSSMALCFVALGLFAATASAQPAYFPSGPQTDVLESTVTSGGWTQCHQDLYSDQGADISDILDGCQGTHMMLACRHVEGRGEGFALLAAALRSDVLTNTGNNTDVTTNSNGSEWYFYDDRSMGFANGGDAVNKQSCDDPGPTTNRDLRLCWHLEEGNTDVGYRCGAVEEPPYSLNGNDDWERVIYVSGAVPTVSPWHLLVLALLLVAAALASRRMWARSN